jgi:DNA-binding MarR family transcriptional regulator
MKIFISWSDETSHEIALTLGEWFPSVIQAVETYVSPEDIRNGTSWVNDVSEELNRSSLGILCVVPGNIETPWLNFEAGVLLKFLDISKVIPLLIDVERSELAGGPLAQFPSAICEKDDMYQILETINKNTENGRLSEERLRNIFDVWWPKLRMDFDSILEIEITEIPDTDQSEETPDTEKPEKKPDTEKPEKKPDTEKPEKAPDTEKPEKGPDTEKPEKGPDTEKPEKGPDTEKPDEELGTDRPEKTPRTEKPEKAPDTEKPEKGPDTEKPEKKPERSVKAAKKSDAEKTEDTEKPKKSVSTKPALDDIEIDLLKVLYKPPGYTPMTAAAVGLKLDIPSQKVREHLDILERKNYVKEHLYVGRSKEYSIAPKGREYLTKHDLVNKRQDK